MRLIIDQIINADVIHHYEEHLMITSKGNVITIRYEQEVKTVNLPLPALTKLVSVSRLAKRALRTDKCAFLPIYDSGNLEAIVGVYQKMFYRIEWPTMLVKLTGMFQQGRVPLHQSICYTDTGNLFLGEYSPNRNNAPVPVWKSDDRGNSWKIIFEFSRDKSRHIHGCFWDPYERKVWVCTGDFEGECNVICADEGFTKIEWLGDGNQLWRTCHPIFKEDFIYWGMDSPLTPSYIIRMERATRKTEKLSPVPGPVWYAKSLEDGWMLFACSVEKGPSVADNYARIFATRDGIDMHNVFVAKKDMWPPVIFKMGAFAFATGRQNTSQFCFFSEAIKGFDGKVCLCKLEM